MDNANQKSIIVSPKSPEKILEEQRIHDVLLLLENLSSREETTIKLIIDCLYDVGANNLINQRVRSQIVNSTLKNIARFSKPVFRMLAWRWFRKNCPQLIANWLYEQVKFPNSIGEVALVVENPVNNQEKIIDQTQEIKYLRSQVKLLILICVIAITSCGGSIFWISHKLEQVNLQPREGLPTQFKTKQAGEW